MHTNSPNPVLKADELQDDVNNTTVHQAMAEASTESGQVPSMKNFSVRLPSDLKAVAQQICERNGTDLGTYLRACTRALVRDYGYAKTAESDGSQDQE